MKIYTADFGNYDNQWEGADVKFGESNDPLYTKGLTPKMRAKQYKMTCLFPEAVWIDGNIEVLERGGFEELMSLNNNDVVFIQHPARYELLSEFKAVRQSGLDSKENIDMAQRLYQGDLGHRVLAGGIIAYRNTKATRHFFDLWYSLTRLTSARDQLSLPFALEVSGISCRVVEEFDIWDNGLFKIHRHA